MPTTSERVKQIIIDHLGVDAARVIDNASLIEDLGADDLDQVELKLELEDAFAIELPEEWPEHAKTVADVVAAIEKQIA